jgi:hypothetical protein
VLLSSTPKRVAVFASTLADAIEALNASWPGMRDRICDSTHRCLRETASAQRARLGFLCGLVVMAISGG